MVDPLTGFASDGPAPWAERTTGPIQATHAAVAKAQRELLVATDLDGCLLDDLTYSYDAARPALHAIARRRVRLVLASSKTRAEMEPLARSLGLHSPLIVENGGALVIPRGDGSYDCVARSERRPRLVAALAEIDAETGAGLRGFFSFTPEELRRLTGLAADAARRALEREYDEPFLIQDEHQAPSVVAAAERRGLRVTRGARFYHLTGATDKGRALRELLTLFARGGRRYTTVGLGDAANDLPLLKAVDRPIVIPRRGRELDRDLLGLAGAERAPAPGPVGWNAAVLTVLRGARLPAARARG